MTFKLDPPEDPNHAPGALRAKAAQLLRDHYRFETNEYGPQELRCIRNLIELVID